MRASELIGKIAIRTKRTAETGDGSYTEDPIFIAYADDDFIVYHTVYGDGENMVIESKPYLLRSDFCDGFWRDYSRVMEVARDTYRCYKYANKK